MPEVNQFTYKYDEVVTLLIKKAGLHEGKWQLIMNFAMTGANIGSGPNDVVPAAIVGITNIGIQRATPESPAPLTDDAAVVNPASTS